MRIERMVSRLVGKAVGLFREGEVGSAWWLMEAYS